MNVKIVFEAVTPSIDDVVDLRNNFSENYPEFSDLKECKDEYNYDDKNVHVAWEGELDEKFCTADNINAIICLTHHAEGLYEDTHLEYVHVEVRINGIWYGKF